jgi:glutamyl-tRNA synthetase
VSVDGEPGSVVAESILMKSDGTPTYHLANVIDDHLMKITHVIRGSEWMASTPLHYDLYTAFGWEAPQFAHVSLLADENKAKLSKRSSSGLVLDVRGMRDQENILPVALCNFLALLGWSNPQKDDLKDMQSLIRDFDLKFTKGNTIVRTEKLWYLQKMHVAKICSDASAGRSPQDHLFEEIVDQILPSALRLCSEFPDHAMFAVGNAEADAVIRAQCRRILLVDSKAYKTPTQYIKERNQYFLLFDPSRVPKEPEEDYEASPSPQRHDLCSFVNDFIHSEPFSTAFGHLPALDSAHQPTEAAHSVKESSCSSLSRSILRASEDITKALDAAIWQRASPQIDFTKCDFSILKGKDALRQWLVTSGQAASEEGAKQVLAEHKRWNMAILHLLRGKLAYGQPGPTTGQVMAVLGLKECKRRLAKVE